MPYNQEVYGKAKTTPKETVARLIAENCFDKTGTLVVYPVWLGAAELFETVEAGLLIRKHHGPATYGATSYHLK